MSARSDFVLFEINGQEFQTWEEYEVTQDLLHPGASWSTMFRLTGSVRERRETLNIIRDSDLRAYLYLSRDPSAPGDRALQLHGIVKQLAVSDERAAATTVRITGNDLGSELAASSCDPAIGVTSETVFVDYVRQIVSPFGMDVLADGVPARTLASGQRVVRSRNEVRRAYARALGVPPDSISDTTVLTLSAGEGSLAGNSRAVTRARRGHGSGLSAQDVAALQLPDAKPGVGETVWEYINRHCRRFGVMPWVSPEGDLIISAPDYDQEPLYRLTRSVSEPSRSNIVGGGFVNDYSAMSSSVTVYGRTQGRDASRSPFRATVEVPELARLDVHRPMVLSDPSVRSEAEALRRARREEADQRQNFIRLEYEVRDHGQGRYFYAVDTMAEIDDEKLGMSGLWYIVARTFRRRRDHGATTMLTLVPYGAISTTIGVTE